MGLRRTVKCEITATWASSKSSPSFLNGDLLAVKNGLGKRSFQNLSVHFLFEFLAIVAFHFVKNFHRIGSHRDIERGAFAIGFRLAFDFPVKVTDSNGRVVAERGKKPVAKPAP